MATATAPAPSDSAPDQAWKPELREIPVDQVTVGTNVRRDTGDITDLAASIETSGLLSPIRVEEAGTLEGAPRYALVYGQRRLAAAKHIGLKTIPALVDAGNRTGAVLVVAQLLENLQREDLNALDTARAYRQLLDAGLTQRELAAQVGLSQPTIANTLALLKAPDEIQQRVAAGELTRSHVEAIVKLPKAEQAEVARRVAEHGLSTRQVEEEIARAAQRQSTEDARRDKLRNRNQELLAGWIAQLLKKKADPETTTLVGFAGTPADGLAALAERGWTKALTAGRGADVTWAERAKGICDCDAYELSYSIDWRGGTETYKPTLKPTCISKTHQAAAKKAYQEVFEAQQAEQREAERQAAEERVAALAPLIELIRAEWVANLPTAKKLTLFAMLSGSENSYWDATRWMNAHGMAFGYDGWRDTLWTAIDELPDEQLLTEIAYQVAKVTFDVGGKVRDAIEALAIPAESKPAKRAKAKS